MSKILNKLLSQRLTTFSTNQFDLAAGQQPPPTNRFDPAVGLTAFSTNRFDLAAGQQPSPRTGLTLLPDNSLPQRIGLILLPGDSLHHEPV
ncbi:hypothetical protein [Mangrovibacterium lignilyticum]|uniref:hypothetical protein n=1 Tax=Mangrovibacterium lignilyticum TaxID=2668052 RepID=UPI0013D02C12|nr:hypothetical protein [Mangrovibacterium lignilyticum]